MYWNFTERAVSDCDVHMVDATMTAKQRQLSRRKVVIRSCNGCMKDWHIDGSASSTSVHLVRDEKDQLATDQLFALNPPQLLHFVTVRLQAPAAGNCKVSEEKFQSLS